MNMSGPATTLGELARLFLRLGVTAFGGPAAHIAMMKLEVVDRRRWLSEQEYLDLLGATNLIPGPNSTEMAIHIGLLRGGWRGLLVSGACFIVPAALMVAGLAWAYASFGSQPQGRGVLYAVKPVIIVVVLQAILGLLRPALKNRGLATLGLVALVVSLAGLDELTVLFGSGSVCGIIAATRKDRLSLNWKAALGLLMLLAMPLGLTALESSSPHQSFSNSALFWFFLKIGSVLYGSGYVLLAFLQGTLVEQWGWLTPVQLLDATAVGQFTPGPVFTTATFIGYLLSGGFGAFLATVAIFLPSFLFVALSGWLLPRVRGSALAAAVLDGVNVAALALMIAVTVELGRSALVDWQTLLIAGISAVLLLHFKINSVWPILAAAAAGLVLSMPLQL